MGLDITSKNDYFRFNWSGVRGFNEWNMKHNMPDWSPNWEGNNDGNKCSARNPEHLEQMQAWVDAFAEKFPDLARQGIGQALRYTQYDMLSLGEETKEGMDWTEEQKEKWEQRTGLAWYWFLKDKIKTKQAFYSC